MPSPDARAPDAVAGEDTGLEAVLMRPPFLSLDFLYIPTADVDATARWYADELGAELVWKVRGMATVVACLRVSEAGPVVLLSGHLEGESPILVYRIADYREALSHMRAAGASDVRELEIPHGPCASFIAAGGARLAIYELVRQGVDRHFAGRVDE
jgi:catechol 2,3-dioxygenase-like lactoylglutathione lyase family enzyme